MLVQDKENESRSSDIKSIISSNNPSEVKDESQKQPQEDRLKVYKRRWFVLAIICSAIAVRSFNQSCYGPINNILSDYFQVQPWQIDWLNSSNALVFVFLSFPMVLVTTRFGFLFTVVAMLVLETTSYLLISLGVAWRSTFPVAMIGELFMASSTIIAASIPPWTAAVWFSRNEVATAVALHVVSRGIGEASGCVIPSLVLKDQQAPNDVRKSLVLIFSTLTIISFGLMTTAAIVVKNRPLLPPSEAQAKIRDAKAGNEDVKSSITEIVSTLKKLFTNKTFIATWFVSGIINPIYRSNTVLFTSILRKNFLEHSNVMNLKSGFALLIGWTLFIAGSFITGPIITKTRAYKSMVVFSLLALFSCCILILIGLKVESLMMTLTSLVMQGFFMGMTNISLFELLTEIIYPNNTMPAVIMVLGLAGVSMLTILVVCRFLLNVAGPLWASAIPIVITGLSPIIILLTKPTYYREQANKVESEETSLIVNNE